MCCAVSPTEMQPEKEEEKAVRGEKEEEKRKGRKRTKETAPRSQVPQ